jgi:hypothetical protein
VAEDAIRTLNARYPRAGGDAFFLFHRPRRWNAGERAWMGASESAASSPT